MNIVPMSYSQRTLGLLLLALVAALYTGCSAKVAADKKVSAPEAVAGSKSKTMENLLAAYNGESNARTRYLAFAKKADAEGYAKAASLFRAAARAEEIHANNHAKVINELGGTPKADIKTPEVNSTAENLKAAVEGESYERDTMYPEFLKQAREDNLKEAVRTFNLARSAEAEHARLYSEARAELASWKTPAKGFYVCPVCGFTTTDPDFEKCPSCFSPREQFELVS
ncbi:MAG: ferritin family protein [Acidobacteriota bacterium]